MTTASEGAVCCVLCSASPVPGVVRESFVVTFFFFSCVKFFFVLRGVQLDTLVLSTGDCGNGGSRVQISRGSVISLILNGRPIAIGFTTAVVQW